MARKKLETQESTKLDLSSTINSYALHKQQLDELKKLCESENAQIKEYMKNNNLESYDDDNGHIVKYSVQERTSMNEAKLLKVMKDNDIDYVIKTQEYVDSDLLEKALYNNELSEEVQRQIADCNEVKYVPQIRLSKTKGGK
jgi:hypothetical protein